MTADKNADDGVLDDVFANDRDRGADSAAPESKPEVTTEPEAKAADPDQPELESKDPFKQYRDPESGRLVPLHELKSERTKRQEEARLREEAERRADQYRRDLEEVQRSIQAAQRQHQQQHQQPPPDVWSDPEGALRYQAQALQQQFAQQRYQDRVATSDALLRPQLKDYDATVNLAIERNGRDPQFMQALYSHPMPGQFAYDAGKRIRMLETIGDDLEGYEAKVREKVLAELKQGNRGQPQRFPGTLADATASGAQGAILTDEAMMGDVFGSDRRSRKRA